MTVYLVVSKGTPLPCSFSHDFSLCRLLITECKVYFGMTQWERAWSFLKWNLLLLQMDCWEAGISQYVPIWMLKLVNFFTVRLSPRLCSSTAGCSPPSVPSIVLCSMLSCPGGSLLCYVVLPSSAWSSPWSLFSPWLPLCASVHLLVHLLSFIRVICLAHFHFCLSVYSMITSIFVSCFLSTLLNLVVLCLTFSFPLLFEQFVSCLLTHFVPQTRISRFDHDIVSACKQETLVLDQYFHFCVPSVGITVGS